MVKDSDEEEDQVAAAMDSDEGEDQVVAAMDSDEGEDHVAAMDFDEGENQVAAMMACDALLNDQVEVPVRHRGSRPCRRIHCRQMLR